MCAEVGDRAKDSEVTNLGCTGHKCRLTATYKAKWLWAVKCLMCKWWTLFNTAIVRRIYSNNVCKLLRLYKHSIHVYVRKWVLSSTNGAGKN